MEPWVWLALALVGFALLPIPEYPCCGRYTYGDEHGVKAAPLAELSAGDYVFFYATLSVRSGAGRFGSVTGRHAACLRLSSRSARDWRHTAEPGTVTISPENDVQTPIS